MNSNLITIWTDPITKAKGYFVIDQLIDGLAGGGIRMKEGVSQEEVQRLAATMTLKMAGLGMPLGGAKAGIDYPSTASDAQNVLKRFLEAHKPFLESQWCTSEDLGTREEDIVRLLNELGLSSSADAYLRKNMNKKEILLNLKEALNLTVDGILLTDIVTGYGVAVSAMEALRLNGIDVHGSKISLQGFGSVGASTAKYLYEAGAKVVAITDINGTIYNEDGLDISHLLDIKDNKGTIDRTKLSKNYQQLPHHKWLDIPVDVLIPAAVADVINLDNVENVQAALIIEAANIPVTKEAEQKLFEKNIYCIPDFIVNAGGAGLFGAILYKEIVPNVDDILHFIKAQLEETVKKVMEHAKINNITPREAAIALLRPD